MIYDLLGAKFIVRIKLLLVLFPEVFEPFVLFFGKKSLNCAVSYHTVAVPLRTLDEVCIAANALAKIAFHTVNAEAMGTFFLTIPIDHIVANLAENGALSDNSNSSHFSFSSFLLNLDHSVKPIDRNVHWKFVLSLFLLELLLSACDQSSEEVSLSDHVGKHVEEDISGYVVEVPALDIFQVLY